MYELSILKKEIDLNGCGVFLYKVYIFNCM